MSICNRYLENKEVDRYMSGGVKKEDDLKEDINNFIM